MCHVKSRNHLASLGKTQEAKADGLVTNEKRIDLRLQPLSLKELMLILVLKYQDTLFTEDLIK